MTDYTADDLLTIVRDWLAYRDRFAKRMSAGQSPLALGGPEGIRAVNEFAHTIGAYSVAVAQALGLPDDRHCEALAELIVNARGSVFGVDHAGWDQ